MTGTDPVAAARQNRCAAAAGLPQLHIATLPWRPLPREITPNRPNGRLPHIPITFQNLSDE
ncbi:hypothetical protein [Burkholderia sp. JP2-270]|uniref:hypothetical protein n=1 Tax=Burkholderia sp. JP2-270 TaxID=2217913 RepID=UPI0013A6D221|nr:hypothetical protein [Burkholderia sp. JP2-270]